MKKIAVILILLVYSTASIGATVHLHYCMNQFAGWDLLHNEDDSKCGKCGMKDKTSDCCRDEHKQIKIKDGHQKNSVSNAVQLITTPAVIQPIPSFVFNANSSVPDNLPTNALPPDPQKRLYITNCVLLI